MLHTSGVKTMLIDSVYNRSNFRTEFRFETEKVYLANMRLLNLGVVSNEDSERSYNSLVGSYGVVKQISLMDGNETLSNMVDFNRYSAFKSFTTKNDDNNSIKKFLQQNQMGYVFSDVDTSGNPALIESLDNTGSITNSETTTAKGWLSLRDCVPFLSSSQYVPTNVFKNLRLVIEYDTQRSSFSEVADLSVSYQTTEPLLVCEMMVNSKVSAQMMMDYKGLSWIDVETDRMVLPAITGVVTLNPNPVQQEKFLVNGFNNKRVNRVVMLNVPSVENTYKVSDNFYSDFSNMGSMGMLNQSVQVVLNGSNLFTEPINTANKRLANVVDNFGDACCPLGYGYYEGMLNQVDSSTEVLNNTDYTAFSLGGARVQELVIEYQRTGQHESEGIAGQTQRRFNQQLSLVLYGEVQKTLVMSGKGQYIIGYA